MTGLATITSKRQFTIPAAAFLALNLRVGQKVVVSSGDGVLKITPAEKLVNELAGSIKVPLKLRGVPFDVALKKALKKHYSKKYGIH